jgi:hypothetical protein
MREDRNQRLDVLELIVVVDFNQLRQTGSD